MVDGLFESDSVRGPGLFESDSVRGAMSAAVSNRRCVTRIASMYHKLHRSQSALIDCPRRWPACSGPVVVKKPYARRWPHGLFRLLHFPSQRSGLASEGAAAHEARYLLFTHRPQQRLGADPVSEEQVVHFLASVADDRGAAAEVRQHPRHRMLHKLM